MRAEIQFLNDGYVNISADEIEYKGSWIMILNGGKMVGIFDEGSVKCAYLTKKEDK